MKVYNTLTNQSLDPTNYDKLELAKQTYDKLTNLPSIVNPKTNVKKPGDIKKMYNQELKAMYQAEAR
jgi:hypothetical protein